MSLASARERVLEAHVISIEKRYVIFYLCDSDKRCSIAPFHKLILFDALVRIGKLVDELQIQKMKNAKVCTY